MIPEQEANNPVSLFDESDSIPVDPADLIPETCDPSLWEKLYPYQREGVAFLLRRFRDSMALWNNVFNDTSLSSAEFTLPRLRELALSDSSGPASVGALLADAMGLGKTVQVAVFLNVINALYKRQRQSMSGAGRAPQFLIAVPSAVMNNWHSELITWCNITVHVCKGRAQLETALRNMSTNSPRLPAVLLTTHQTAANNISRVIAPTDGVLVAESDLGRRMTEPFVGLHSRGFHQTFLPSAARTPTRANLDACIDEFLKRSSRSGARTDPRTFSDWTWDLVVVDEAHALKNSSSKVTQKMRLVPAVMRLALTGTPMENSVDELQSLLHWTTYGLHPTFRDATTFSAHFTTPISDARLSDASAGARRAGDRASENLQYALNPLVLRRTRGADGHIVAGSLTGHHDQPPALPQPGSSLSRLTPTSPLAGSLAVAGAGAGAGAATTTSGSVRATKYDVVLWCQMMPTQRTLYNAFLSYNPVNHLISEAQVTRRISFVLINLLRKICDHPLSLTKDNLNTQFPASSAPAALTVGDAKRIFSELRDDARCHAERIDTHALALHPPSADYDSPSTKPLPGSPESNEVSVVTERLFLALERLLVSHVPVDLSLSLSGKLRVLENIALHLYKTNHRMLIFAQHKKTVHMIGQMLTNHQLDTRVITGDMNAGERQNSISTFNAGAGFALVLTLKCGGTGLNIVGADRVVIFDPNWNPSQDAQAVGRVYRPGQTADDVVAYRLVSADSLEERVFRRQIYKAGVAQAAVDAYDSFRHFSHQDIFDIFTAVPARTVTPSIASQPTGPTPPVAVADELRVVHDMACVAGYAHYDALIERADDTEAPEEGPDAPRRLRLTSRSRSGSRSPPKNGGRYELDNLDDMRPYDPEIDGADVFAPRDVLDDEPLPPLAGPASLQQLMAIINTASAGAREPERAPEPDPAPAPEPAPAPAPAAHLLPPVGSDGVLSVSVSAASLAKHGSELDSQDLQQAARFGSARPGSLLDLLFTAADADQHRTAYLAGLTRLVLAALPDDAPSDAAWTAAFDPLDAVDALAATADEALTAATRLIDSSRLRGPALADISSTCNFAAQLGARLRIAGLTPAGRALGRSLDIFSEKLAQVRHVSGEAGAARATSGVFSGSRAQRSARMHLMQAFT